MQSSFSECVDMMIKAGKLRPGDKVAAVSLSWGGPGTFPQRYRAGVTQLEAEFGLQVIEMPNTLREADWLARNPRARADDLMAAFEDPAIKGIISTIGGEDSIRIAPYLDLDVIRENPKVFLGYSDTTVSHLACFKAGLVTFYGPAIMAGFAENGGMFTYMVDSVYKTIFNSGPIGEIQPNSVGWTVEIPGLGRSRQPIAKAKSRAACRLEIPTRRRCWARASDGRLFRGVGLA